MGGALSGDGNRRLAAPHLVFFDITWDNIGIATMSKCLSRIHRILLGLQNDVESNKQTRPQLLAN
jgi:hypothetical protein